MKQKSNVLLLLSLTQPDSLHSHSPWLPAEGVWTLAVAGMGEPPSCSWPMLQGKGMVASRFLCSCPSLLLLPSPAGRRNLCATTSPYSTDQKQARRSSSHIASAGSWLLQLGAMGAGSPAWPGIAVVIHRFQLPVSAPWHQGRLGRERGAKQQVLERGTTDAVAGWAELPALPLPTVLS